MQIPGHLAVAVAQYRLFPADWRTRRNLGLVLTACLLPDVVDKSIGYVFHAMPNGRHFAHNIFSLLGLSVLASAVGGVVAGRVWFWGHLGHLLADFNSMIPWWFPAKKYRFKPGRLKFEPAQLAGETILLALVWFLTRFIR